MCCCQQYWRMATTEAPKQWLGLGSMGWAIYALAALVNLALVFQNTTTLREFAIYSVVVALTLYLMFRVYKFIATLFFRAVN